MLDCVQRGTKEQGVPMGFCAPGANQKTSFEAHDSHMGFPQSDAGAS